MDDLLARFVAEQSSPELPILNKIFRETHLYMPFPRMVSDHAQGLLLQFISNMLQADRVLEIGTFTGYAAICLAQGLSPAGSLDTIELNPELEDRVRDYFKQAGLESRIRLHLGDARHLLAADPGLQGPYDLVFIDADKEQYIEYYELVLPRTRKGGIILVDNVLWGGKVLTTVSPSDKEAYGIQRFNNLIRDDERVARCLLPLRDGLMMLRKR